MGHGCNDIDEGLELGKQKIKKVFAFSDVLISAEIYAKSKKKVFTSLIPSFPRIGYLV